MDYRSIKSLKYRGNCTDLPGSFVTAQMDIATRANKQQVHTLLRRLNKRMFKELQLNYFNPYNYYKTEKYIIVVHSRIEYFFEYSF